MWQHSQEVTVNRGEGVAQALWYVAPGRAEIRPARLAEIAGDAVRVRTLHSAFSRGTEALIAAGRVPSAEYGRMRAPHMEGEFPFPVKYGYCNVGEVAEGPQALAGRTVFSLYPHQSEYVVSADSVVPLPQGIPPARAVLAANMETALNAVWDVQPGPADHIAVIGAGVVGCLVAWLCARLPGAQVTLVDIDRRRAGIAAQLGADFSLPEHAAGDCDVVFHASGAPQGLATAIRLAGDEAAVAEMSWYGEGDIPVPLGGAFHSRRLRLISTQVGQVAATHRARWSHRRRLQAGLELLRDPALDTLFAPAIRFDDVPARIADVLASESGILCQRIDYT